jgi:hypothetical protein
MHITSVRPLVMSARNGGSTSSGRIFLRIEHVFDYDMNMFIGPTERETNELRLTERVATLSAQIHALTTELIDAVVEAVEGDAPQGWGARSVGHWLAIAGAWTLPEAHRIVRVAQRRETLGPIFEMATRGEVPVPVLDAVAKVITPENADKIQNVVATCTPTQTQRVLAKYRELLPKPADDKTSQPSPEPLPEYWWRHWTDEAGRGRFDAALSPLASELLEEAYAAASKSLLKDQEAETRAAESATETAASRASEPTSTAGSGSATRSDSETGPEPAAGSGSESEPGSESFPASGSGSAAGPGASPESTSGGRPSPGRWYPPRNGPDANAAVRRMAEHMLADARRNGVRRTGGEPFTVLVTVDLETLLETLGLNPSGGPFKLGSQCFTRTGRRLTTAELADALQSSTLQTVVTAEGVTIWMGRETRFPNRHQRRLLNLRGNGTCEIPGCTNKVGLAGHHVIHYEHDGPTSMCNLLHVCGPHHRQLHREGWRITSVPGSQRFTIDTSTGRCLGSTHPDGPPPDLKQIAKHQPDAATPPTLTLAPNATRKHGGGAPLTRYALDVFLTNLLAA